MGKIFSSYTDILLSNAVILQWEIPPCTNSGGWQASGCGGWQVFPPDLESMGPVCPNYVKELKIPSCSNDTEQRIPNSSTYEAPGDPRPLCDDNATSSFQNHYGQ